MAGSVESTSIETKWDALLKCLAWESCESPVSNKRELCGRNKISTVWST